MEERVREGNSLSSPPLLFIAFFTSHRSPLSERLEQARVGRECNSGIMGDGLLVKTKNRSETVVLKSIQCFGHRYIVFFF